MKGAGNSTVSTPPELARSALAHLFWVLVPTGGLYDAARKLQERLEERFQLYQGRLPPLHVTIARVASAGDTPRRAAEALRPVCKATRPFWIWSRGWVYFEAQRAIALRILPGPGLLQFAVRSRRALSRHGIARPGSMGGWAFHLTLASNTFARRPWSEAEYHAAIALLSGEPTAQASLIEGAELWHPIYEPRLRVVARFPFGAGRDSRGDGAGT